MSCFRCGKELPDLQTECEPPCDEVRAHDHGPNCKALIIQIPMDEKAVEKNDIALRIALIMFSNCLRDAMIESGAD